MEIRPLPRICVSLLARTNREALIGLEQGFALADLVELRLDGLRKVNLKKLMASRKREMVITNRSPEEGGFSKGGEEDRVALLNQAVALGAGYVDLEIRTKTPLISTLKKTIAAHQGRTRLILSYHDFDKTPHPRELRQRLDQGIKAGADIVKLVSLATRMEDNLTLLALIPYGRKEGVEVIAFCMGEQGKISRVMAPLLGSFLTYASLARGKEAAPGQMTVEEMKEIFTLLGSSGKE